MTPPSARPALRLEGIRKSFPGVRALEDVSVDAFPGEVHAILGENGAGKSTLIKIASGALQPDAGQVLIDDEPVGLSNPVSAMKLGIRVVHQERQIAEELTVAENLVLDDPGGGHLGFVTSAAIRRKAEERLARIGVELDVRQPARLLSVADQQLVELARTINYSARVVILDEPTASLHPAEIGRLFEVVARLRDLDIAVLYISHHLDEVFRLADRITVLRDGKHVVTDAISQLTPDQVIAAMFGSVAALDRNSVRRDHVGDVGSVAIRARGVSYGRFLRDVDLDVRHGEVLAITGAVGSGTRELGLLLGGAIAPTAGTLEYSRLGREPRSRREAAAAGVAYLPSDRKREGLMLDRPATENVVLAEQTLGRRTFVSPARVRARSTELSASLNVRGNIHAAARTLSGGNQQKAVLARWVACAPDVYVLDEPTAGVDIPSKAELYRRLLEAARAGAAVVVISTDFREIHCLADRVIVVRGGRCVGQLRGDQATEHQLFATEMDGG